MTIITFLQKSEIEKFDTTNELDEKDRPDIFLLSDLDNSGLDFRKPISKIGYILQSGYFRVHKKFFVPKKFNKKDIDFVARLLQIKNPIEISDYKTTILSNHRKTILRVFNFKSFHDSKGLFVKEAQALVKTTLKPRDILHSLLDYLHERKIEIPKYYVFSSTMSQALNNFESDLILKMDSILTENQKNILDDFMKLPSNQDDFSSKNPYLLTNLKKPEQGITPKKIKESLGDFYIIQDLHSNFITTIDKADISKELLNYYAVWLIKSKHLQFDSISSVPLKRLYLIAFIVYQYRLRQDLFVDTLLQCVPKYYNETEKIVGAQFLNQNFTQEINKINSLSSIKNIILSSKKQMIKVKEIVSSHQYHDNKKIELITQILFKNEKTFQDKLLEELLKLDAFNGKRLKDKMFFIQLSKRFRKIQNRVGNIVQILEFNLSTSNNDIMNAIRYYKEGKGKITDYAPIEFVTEKDQKWLFNKLGEIDKGLYKVILFKEISKHIKAGSLNLKYSDKFKSIDEYLISSENWNSDRIELINRANLDHFLNFEDFINESKGLLNTHYEKINKEFFST